MRTACSAICVVLLVLSLQHTSNARSVPAGPAGTLNDQKTFLPCFTRKLPGKNIIPAGGHDQQMLVHASASAPTAESPDAGVGLKDKKNFIFGGVGGWAGMGGYGGMIGGLPIMGGIGKFGGIGGAAGVGGGLGGVPGGGAGGATGGGVGGLGGGIFPCHP